MKKVLFVGMAFGALALTSCKKEYKCEYPNGSKAVYNDKDHSSSEIKSAKVACAITDGKWSE
ncbi:MAG TPA: hypothetical protein VKY37_05500 [Brumimicrobium sp.]|nr:hypothetical protein [Brumimicrobium sp.]